MGADDVTTDRTGEGGVVMMQGAELDGSALESLELTPELKSNTKILLVDDDRMLCDSCATVLGAEGYATEVCYRGDEALQRLRNRSYDIVLIDLYMSQVSGMELVRACQELQPQAIAIVITGNPSVASSLAVLRAGAWDYLPKPFSAQHIQLLIGRAVHAVAVARETEQIEVELQERHGHGEKIVGVSPAFRRVIDLARKVARTDASTFITGESGTGKELIARFIHEHSRRSSRPLIALNCAALPGPLLESEMFGHVKGAFTGAEQDKQGLIEAANGGTLFLDELPEMDPALQAKLLRVIQDGIVRRVGSTKTDAVVNVRLIAATNRDPDAAVEEGLLRQDLYFRLNVVPIHLPALREREVDIPILARMFLARYWSRHREVGTPVPTLTEDAIQALKTRRWRGNVRELQNVLEQAVVLFEGGSEMRAEHLSIIGAGPGPAEPNPPARTDPFAPFMEQDYKLAREQLVSEFERKYLARVLQLADGSLTRAAAIARVDRTTLYRLMQRQNLTMERLLRDDDEDREEPEGGAAAD